MTSLAHHRYTWDEYRAFERASNSKHEFLDGEIFAMAGGTPQHARLTAAVLRDLGVQLRGKPCVPYSSDLRIRVAATGLATYPDVSVVCGALKRDANDRQTVLNPTLLVEVLSPSTSEYDLGKKLDHYKKIPSLQEVVFAAHREPHLAVHRRGGRTWRRAEAREGEELELSAIGCTLRVDDVYEGIDLAE